MTPEPGKNYILRRKFSDFDEYTEIFTGNQWDMGLEQLGRGEFKADLVSLSMGPFVVNHVKVNRSLLVQGQTSGENSIFGIPVDMDSHGTWMRKLLGLDSVQRYAQEREFEAVTPEGFETITCSFAGDNSAGAFDFGDDVGSLQNPDISVSVNCGSRVKGQLISRFSRLLNQFQQNPGLLEQQSCVSDCCKEIYALLGQIDVVGWDLNSTSRRKGKARVVERALEYLDSTQGEPVSVQELRQHAIASRSTLERAFKEHFGILPKTYLMARRLNGVRRMLLKSDPANCKISNVAAKWGFWHMSQFAADYRRQFGELPSETLTRTRHSR